MFMEKPDTYICTAYPTDRKNLEDLYRHMVDMEWYRCCVKRGFDEWDYDENLSEHIDPDKDYTC